MAATVGWGAGVAVSATTGDGSESGVRCTQSPAAIAATASSASSAVTATRPPRRRGTTVGATPDAALPGVATPGAETSGRGACAAASPGV